MIALNTQSGLEYLHGGLDGLKYQKGPWTSFMDMHSGGSTKVKTYEYIYIQMAEEDARVFFSAMFGRSPGRVTCDCCGPDYSISEYATLEEATKYVRTYIRPKGEDIETYAAQLGALVVITQEQPKEVTDAREDQ